jgi:phosphatidate cytidylyltransferase
MKDPKPARGGSGDPEPATPSFEAATPNALAQHQFPSRRARRTAELTGMIPIVPMPTAVAKPAAAVQPAPADAEKPDAVASDAGDATGAAAPAAGPEVTPGAAAGSPAAPGADRADVPEMATAGTTDPKTDAPEATDGSATEAHDDTPETSRGVRPATAPHKVRGPASLVAKPVPALVPPVPVPSGPIAPIPAGLADEPVEKAPRTPRAGRDLPAAIGVGIALLVVVVGSLLFYPVAFVGVATVLAVIGVWEVTRAIAGKGIKAPMTPVMIGTLAMPASAYFAGAEGLLFAFVAACTAVLLWRCLDSAPGAIHSIFAGIFALTWVPFLLSFVFLMLRDTQPPTTGLTLDLSALNPGVLQVIIMLFLVVANDTFGYLVGVLFGKHPMAPKISPKKSWEGFAGSMGGAILVAVPCTIFLLNEQWWVGVVLAVGMVLAGTSGDFAESMVKRELGIKDMSNLLPGHGGMMDRLDSILFAAPVAFITLSVLGSM